MEALTRERLYFESIKESRGNYFVEYQPPVGDGQIANLTLVYSNEFKVDEVGERMRAEMVHWIARYPVPVMVGACDAAENTIRPNGNDDDGYLIGWLEPATRNVASAWGSDNGLSFLSNACCIPDWREIYTDIPYKTDSQVKEDAKAKRQIKRKQKAILITILMFWLAAIPATWSTVQYFGSSWLALAVYIYELWQAFRAARKLLGYGKPSQSEKRKTEKEQKMAHYYYHCERNPDGFSRLKAENFEKDIIESTRKEAEDLAKQ
jgi:hypothetical protein